MNILWIPHTTWSRQQRARPFCMALVSRGHEVHVTDWVADFQGLGDYCSRRYLENFVYHRSVQDGILVHRIPRFSPAIHNALLRRLNDRVFSRFLASIIASHRIDAVVSTGIVSPPEFPNLIFDLYDDNPAYWRTYGHANNFIAEEIAAREAAYLSSARFVAAASPVLYDKACMVAPKERVKLIPNTVDLDRFSKADGKEVRRALALTGKVVGLIGRLDREHEVLKVVAAAERLEGRDLTYLVVGGGKARPLFQQEVKKRQLRGFVFVDTVPPSEVVPYFAALDVGLCPYAKTPADDARSPIRLLEYSAAGCAVVCTDLESVRRMGFCNVILVEDNSEALASGIVQACQHSLEVPPKLAAYDINALTDTYEALIMARGDQ